MGVLVTVEFTTRSLNATSTLVDLIYGGVQKRERKIVIQACKERRHCIQDTSDFQTLKLKQKRMNKSDLHCKSCMAS